MLGPCSWVSLLSVPFTDSLFLLLSFPSVILQKNVLPPQEQIKDVFVLSTEPNGTDKFKNVNIWKFEVLTEHPRTNEWNQN